MTLIKSALLFAGLSLTANAQAMSVWIDNANFNAINLNDGATHPIINGWDIEYGLSGLYNPPNSVFIGEEGNGAHRNTMYMIDSGLVSQSLDFRALEDSIYTLSFDVGQRTGISAQTYSVKITAGEEILLWTTNPDRPSAPGTFTRAEVKFTNQGIVGENMKIEIQTVGTGHLHFDNFELHYQQEFSEPEVHLRPVAYGVTQANSAQPFAECLPEYSLQGHLNIPYMRRGLGECRCDDSIKVLTGESSSEELNGSTTVRRYYKCVIRSDK